MVYNVIEVKLVVFHFLFQCSAYAAIREALFANFVSFSCFNDFEVNNVTSIIQKRMYEKVILNGDILAKNELNINLFKAIHEFIKDSKRFI